MSDESAEKAWLKLPGQQRWATDREIEAFRAGRASRDAEVAELDKRLESESGRANEEHLNVMRLTEKLASERTRADKAEAEMHSRELHHFEVEEENESLREVIERVREGVQRGVRVLEDDLEVAAEIFRESFLNLGGDPKLLPQTDNEGDG